jgi:putative redox protein
VRDHTIYTDQPVEDGGADSAPTPTELFLAGFAGCVAFYAERYLRRHQLSTRDFAVSCEWTWADAPHRVGSIELTVEAPGLPAAREEAFRRVIDHCTIHNTLRHPPEVGIRVLAAGAVGVL